MSNPSSTRNGTVLVVDDEAMNRDLLRACIESMGLGVLEASDGPTALEAVARGGLDVIILDIMMPGMDGFEVCRRIRKDPAHDATPVLIITALADRQSRIEGIESGANDYIHKPIDPIELSLRVRNAFRLKSQHDSLLELEEERRQLSEMIVHDLRSPLGSIRGILELLLQRSADSLGERDRPLLERVVRGTRRLQELIEVLLDVSRLEEGGMPLSIRTVTVGSLLEETKDMLAGLLDIGQLEILPADPETKITCDPDLIRRVLVNLLANSLHHGGREVHITLEHRAGPDSLEMAVVDDGPGIPSDLHERIFQKHGMVGAPSRRKHMSRGLGLPFCKLAVEAHGGRIGIESDGKSGSRFWFRIPHR